MGRTVGGQDDLLVALVEIVEGMEELLLRGVFAGNELNIVDQEQVRAAVFEAELVVLAFAQSVDQLVGELVALDIDDVVVRMRFVNLVGNGIEQVRLADAGRAVDEKRVIGICRLFRDGDGCGVCKAVAVADDEVIEGELRIELNETRLLFARAVGVDLRFIQNDQLKLHVEQILERFLNIDRAARDDHVLAEGRRREEDELLIGQLQHLGVVKPGRDDGGRELLLHVTENLRPDIR